jgi:hypothetical protein
LNESNLTQIKDLSPYVGSPGVLAFVVRQGGILPAKARRAVCDEANGTSQDYVASAVYHETNQDAKRWVDIGPLKSRVTEEQYFIVNQFLGLKDNDAIFIGTKPSIFTVLIYISR